jgi:hypothetical protein
MRLIGNKKGITYVNISERIPCKEINIRNSDINIWAKQEIWIHSLIESNYLMHNIYNDINRE